MNWEYAIEFRQRDAKYVRGITKAISKQRYKLAVKLVDRREREFARYEKAIKHMIAVEV